MGDLTVWQLGPHECTYPHEIWDAGRRIEQCSGGGKIVLRATAGWLPTKQYEAFQVHNQMGEWVDDVTGTTVYVVVDDA